MANISNKPRLTFEKSKLFTRDIQRIIPGGAHTYSRGADQFPENAPSGITRGEGARVWDIDGNRLVDWNMALFSTSLGYGQPDVVRAVYDAIRDGVGFTRPSLFEYQAAEEFLDVFGGDMVKFAKHGSTITTAAVKLARAFTGRGKVAVPREHPFFSFDDWFIVSTPVDFGIPPELSAYTLNFSYNNLDSLDRLFRENPEDIACVIMEGVRWDEPVPGFLAGVRDLCDRYGALLIIDEMINGLKLAVRGAAEVYDIRADLTTWGKGLANGFAASALSGRGDVMRLGGLEREGTKKLFLVSTTHGAEISGLAAMRETLRQLRDGRIIRENWQRGAVLRNRLEQITAAHGLKSSLVFSGFPPLWLVDVRGAAGSTDLRLKTLFQQELLAWGVLWQGTFCLTPCHGESEFEDTADAWDRACRVLRQAVDQGSVEGLLVGPPVKPVFRKYV